MRCLITGGTGFVGSHVAEACSKRGWEVVALARVGSDVRVLERIGARLVRGDVTDAGAVREAVRGVDSVIHCAAKVGDWGHVDDYRKVNVEGLRNLLEAVRGQPLHRFVHLSSLGVYEARDHFATDETEPLPSRHIDGYTQSKVEAEQLALQYFREHGVPVTVLRPGFVYGPRDRTVVPRLIDLLARKDLIYVGDGSQALNTIYVGNLVEAVLLALERPEAVGEVFNLTDGEQVSKRRFLETLADVAELPRPSKSVPRWLVRMLTPVIENLWRAIGAKGAPRLTQARLKFIGLNLDFSIEKARRRLGYQPRPSLEEGLRQAVEWWRKAKAEEDSLSELTAVDDSHHDATQKL